MSIRWAPRRFFPPPTVSPALTRTATQYPTRVSTTIAPPTFVLRLV